LRIPEGASTTAAAPPDTSRAYAELRGRAVELAAEMRDLYRRGHTPRARPSKGCGSCSLRELCLPRLAKAPAVARYLAEHIKDS
jgi:CRISPR-associated exonuclease Cas4